MRSFSHSGRRLVHIDADEPSDAMMAKIASVVDQSKLSADESIPHPEQEIVMKEVFGGF